MKKAMLGILTVFAVAAVSQAAVIRQWNPAATISGIPDPFASDDPFVQAIHTDPLADGVGSTWRVTVLDVSVDIDPFAGVALELGTPVSTSGPLYFSSSTPGQPNLGYQSGAGSFVLQGGGSFPLTAPEGATVRIVLFGNEDGPVGPAYSWIASAPLTLPTIADDPPPPGSTNVTFSFADSEWQAIPEPGTVAVMLMGGLGLLVSRRRRVKAGA